MHLQVEASCAIRITLCGSLKITTDASSLACGHTSIVIFPSDHIDVQLWRRFRQPQLQQSLHHRGHTV